MLRKIVFSILLLSVGACYAAEKKHVLNIQTWKTDNGVAVFFVQAKEIPMVDIQEVFVAGSSYDQNNWGLASLTNTLIGRGTKTQNANQIADAFDSVGAQFNNNVNRDMAVLSLRSLTEQKYLRPALKTFHDVVVNATFPQADFDRTKNRVMAGIKIALQQPGPVASREFYRTLYADQPYGHAVSGDLQTVSAMTLSQVQSFYRQYYVANNLQIIIVGDVSLDKAKQISSQLALGIPAGHIAAELPQANSLKQAINKHITFPSNQTAMLLGQVGINRKSPDYFPLIVGNYILGGFPLSSLIIQQIRVKRGLAYAAYSTFSPLKYRGPFVVSLKTRANKSQEALSVVRETLATFLREGPSKDLLQLAKQTLTGSFAINLASNKSIDEVVRNIAFYHRPLDYLDHYRARVNAVTAKQVNRAFSKVIKPNAMLTVTVGPATKNTKTN